MDMLVRFEQALADSLARLEPAGCPAGLAAAMNHSVFPGGARIRPKLCLAVAMACGGSDPRVAMAAAMAVEFLHCASLVHDDLPCFDDAEVRRGQPAVHRAFGEPLAVLAGDALIVRAFEVLAEGAAHEPARLVRLVSIVGAAVGAAGGIVAGQAWECEPDAELARYHRQKTGALFVGATMAGAAAAGVDPEPWRALGACIGDAYQIADDICDVAGDPSVLGKPTGRDAALGRPSVAQAYGLDGAVARLDAKLAAALDSIPPCPGARELRDMVRAESTRFRPQTRVAVAA